MTESDESASLPTHRHGTLVDWYEWGPEPFALAARDQQPVLLSLSTPWCRDCAEMDATVYADPMLAAHIGEGFVPIRVDADRRPGVRERYSMGGFPSTVFTTPAGEPINGATLLDEVGFRGLLDAVRERWAAAGTAAGQVPPALAEEPPPVGRLDSRIEAHMVEQVAEAFDEQFGGWGEAAKFPLAGTIRFALKRDRERGRAALDAALTHLQDADHGGWYRFAENRDWARPHRETLLDENAALLRTATAAYLYTGAERYRQSAAETVAFLESQLWTGQAFAGSRPAPEPAPGDGEEPSWPARDETIFADRNGLAAGALLAFSALTDDGEARRLGLETLDHLLETLVNDGVVAHMASSERPRGLLSDQARLLGGLTRASQLTGEQRYTDSARGVADALEPLQSAEGVFIDARPSGPALLDRPLRPLEANVEAALALQTLGALVEDDRYRDWAGDALAGFAGASDRMGAELAPYGAACARQLYEPLVIHTPPAGSDLHRAALRVADHEKVVVPGSGETAVVQRGSERSAPAGSPAALSERVAETSQPSIE